MATSKKTTLTGPSTPCECALGRYAASSVHTPCMMISDDVPLPSLPSLKTAWPPFHCFDIAETSKLRAVPHKYVHL